MRHIRIALIGGFALLTGAWLAADPDILTANSFRALRQVMVQYTGIAAFACMSVALMLAARPRWPEAWFGGLDKMYRLHKWLGIAALSIAVVHWVWERGPEWLVDLGLMQHPEHGPPHEPDGVIDAVLRWLRNPAQSVGEWLLYAVVVLIVLALLKRIPYRTFFTTHRLLAAAHLGLVFHALVLVKPSYWASPLGVLLALLMVGGSGAAVLALTGRIGAGRRVSATITAIHAYPSSRCVEVQVDMPDSWPGHKAGQFAFLTLSAAEGAHPYTIASAWSGVDRRLNFVIKELGDHTRRLRKTLRIGQEAIVEGPYGCFNFEDSLPCQVWIGAGIGITPFIARMKELAARPAHRQRIDLFHTTANHDDEVLAKLRTDAEAAGIRLHVLIDERDGVLTGERIQSAVPMLREGSIWFCGPAAFGNTLKREFARMGVPVQRRFQQELFAMR